MQKTITIIIICLFILIPITGCGEKAGAGKKNNENANPQNLVPVSFYYDDPYDTTEYVKFQLIRDKMYYIKINWNEDSGILEEILYSKSATEDIAERKIEEFNRSKISCYVADEKDNLYIIFITQEKNQKIPYLKKINESGQEVFCNSLAEYIDDNDLGNLSGGVVDKKGKTCFVGYMGEFYLFDENGNLHKTGQSEWSVAREQGFDAEGVVNAGEEGCYLYAVIKNTIFFKKIDMNNGIMGKEIKIAYDNNKIPPVILNGYEKGILLAEENALLSFHPKEQKKEVLVDFLNEHVNIMGGQTEQIGILDNGQLLIFLYDVQQYISEQAFIKFLPKEQVKPKQTVVLGMSPLNMEMLEQWIKRFNRQSMDYKVILKLYDDNPDGIGSSMFDLYKDILDGKAADIIEIARMSMKDLASKGMLEDLEPYLEKSSVISREDILPSVWKAGTYKGTMQALIPSFYIRTLVVRKENMEGSTWTVDDFISLAERYPESNPFRGRRKGDILNLLMTAEMERFVDWENRKADFEQNDFIDILKFIGNLKIENQNDFIMSQHEESEQLMTEKWLLSECYLGNMQTYLYGKEAYGEKASFVSFPNEEAVPWYPMYNDYTFAINSASQCKNGAWAFLEYLMSEKVQEKYTGAAFPVREKTFQDYIRRKDILPPGLVHIEYTEEDISRINEMVGNMYLNEYDGMSRVQGIIDEECRIFLQGRKGAEETARIIQNRVQLFLDE